MAEMVAQYQRAKYRLDHSRPGSVKAREAERTIARLVAYAERRGILSQFLQAINV